jgi:hypothetical protein
MKTDDPKYQEILLSLERSFPGKILLGVKDTGGVLDFAPRTIYNGISRGARKPFPIKPVRSGGVKFRIHDIARYLAQL